jgi:hypothetical protein
MHIKAKLFTKGCYYCDKSRNNQLPLEPLGSNFTVTQPRIVWSLDIAQGLPRTTNNNVLIHVFLDYFSLYTVLVPHQSKSSEALIHSFLTYVIKPFLPPIALRSDQERGIVTADKFYTFVTSLGIRLLPTAAYAPWTNGQVENRIKQLKTLLRITCCTEQTLEWDNQLPLIQASLNRTVGTYGYSSEEIMFGTVTPTPMDILQVTEPPGNPDDYIERVQARYHKICTTVQELREKNRRSLEQRRNAHRSTRTFNIGDIVKIRDLSVRRYSALAAPYIGPYTIREISSHLHTAIVEDLLTGVMKKVHYNHMETTNHLPMTFLNSNWDKDLRELTQRPDSPTPPRHDDLQTDSDSDDQRQQTT